MVEQKKRAQRTNNVISFLAGLLPLCGVVLVCTPAFGQPTAKSVAPASGSGASQTFTYTISDPDGYSDVTQVHVAVVEKGVNSVVNGCYILFDAPSNELKLRDDANTDWVGAATAGEPGTLENSQCVLDAGSSKPTSGTDNQLTFGVALSFKTSFSGDKQNGVNPKDTDSQQRSTPWSVLGSWTVP